VLFQYVQQHGSNCNIVSDPEVALIPLTFLICVHRSNCNIVSDPEVALIPLTFLICVHGSNCNIVSDPEVALIPLTFLICVHGRVIVFVVCNYCSLRQKALTAGLRDDQISP
jgi:hypothetical protein